jgi:hypothetical protein
MSELLVPVRDRLEPPEVAGYKVRWAHCRNHDERYLETWIPSLDTWTAISGCPICKLETETGRPLPRRGQSVEDFRLGLACVPERFRGKRLKDFAGKNFRQAVEVARSFEPTDSLMVVGPLGAGKTSLGCALLRELLEMPAEPSGMYVTTADLMEGLWRDANPGQWVEGHYTDPLTESLRRFGAMGLLLIDDIQEIHTAEELSWLQRVLAARHAANLGTMVIGAPDLQALESVLGSRTLNQLRGWKQISLGKERD